MPNKNNNNSYEFLFKIVAIIFLDQTKNLVPFLETDFCAEPLARVALSDRMLIDRSTFPFNKVEIEDSKMT